MASAAKGTIDISLKDVTSDVNGILTENEGDIYPNLHAFVTELGKSCRGTVLSRRSRLILLTPAISRV